MRRVIAGQIGLALLLPCTHGVNEINDASILAALGRQMTHAVARESVAASNLANIDTPGYRTKDAAFADALEGQLNAAQPVQTHAAHLASPNSERDGSTIAEVGGLASKRDGNNVQLDRELLALNQASGDFSAAQTALSAKFRLVRYAINEGR